MAYRLGWVLYWTCLSLAVVWSLGGGWAVFFLWVLSPIAQMMNATRAKR